MIFSNFYLLFFIMLFTDKKFTIKDYPVNKDYGDDEPFFRLFTEGGEVSLPKLKFQIGQPLPDFLNCRIKGYNGAVPIIGHNMPRYVSEFYADGYSKGKEFEFKVINVPDEDFGFYRLTDDNGLTFRLYDSKTALTKGQSVKCKFEYLEQNAFKLRRSNSDALFPMLSFGDLARVAMIHGVNAFKIEQYLKQIPELANALDEREQGRTVWTVSAIRAVRKALPRLFLEAVKIYPNEFILNIINGYDNVLMYLLQGSNFLREIKGAERIGLQAEITSQLEQLDIYRRALHIISSDGQNKFIRELLTNLKVSGYIYHPTLQFSILMLLFRLSPELVNSSLGGIYDTLMGWDLSIWKNEPFRQAFVDQFEIFITETREEIESFLQPEVQDDDLKIEKILTAIAIQQALALPSDNINLDLNISLFYRYLSLLRTAKADVLLNKSFLTLLGVKLPTDFTWSDIKEPTMMMTRASVDPPANAKIPDNPKYYFTNEMEVEVGPEGISITPVHDEGNNKIINGLFNWIPLKVNVNMKYDLKPSKARTLEGHHEFWNNIESALFTPVRQTPETCSTKLNADINDTVRIVIDRVVPKAGEPNKVELFHCKIVDEQYNEGEGFLHPEDLVNYNLHGVSVGTFRYNDGKAMMFDAQVIDIDDNNNYKFSLFDSACDAIRNMVNIEERYLCVITKDNGRSYSAISQKGFGLYVNKDPDEVAPYRCGNRIEVVVTNIDNDIIQSEVVDGPLDMIQFSNERALHNLMLEIAVPEDNYETTDDMDLDEEDCISREYLREIADILRFKAISHHDDIIRAFDYLSFARLLAIIINDDALARELKAHKGILLQLRHYAKNKKIYSEEISDILAEAPESVFIKRMAARLNIVAALSDPEKNQMLWSTANNSVYELDRDLASSVLSFNLLNAQNHDEAAISSIKEAIAMKLNVNSEQHKLKYYASESQYVEYKSSLVYPANKGKAGISMADPERQEHEILHIIAGFLNTEGGKLYIGVGDDHYERGLDEDLKFYSLHSPENSSSYRRSIKSLDNIANYLQVLIDSKFNIGKNAGEYAKTFIDEESNKGVVGVDILPCPHIVKLDGVIYARHGSKTEPYLKPEDIEMFINDREKLYKQTIESRGIQVDDSIDSNVAVTVDSPTKPQSDTNASVDTVVPEERKFAIATSRVRANVLHEWEEHYATPSFILRFSKDAQFALAQYDWECEEDDLLNLVITEDEVQGYLLMVFENELTLKVRIRELLDKQHNCFYPHYSEAKLVFVCPIDANGGLYSLHSNGRGALYERVTPAAKIPNGSMISTPERLLEAECAETPFYECVKADKMELFSQILSSTMKRMQLGALAKGSNIGTVKVDEIVNLVTNQLK